MSSISREEPPALPCHSKRLWYVSYVLAKLRSQNGIQARNCTDGILSQHHLYLNKNKEEKRMNQNSHKKMKEIETGLKPRKRFRDDREDVMIPADSFYFQLVHNKKRRTWNANKIVPNSLFAMFKKRKTPSITSWLSQANPNINIKGIESMTESQKRELFGQSNFYWIQLIINHEYAVIDATKTNYGESGVYFRTYEAPIKGWWDALMDVQSWPTVGVFTISTNDEGKTIIQKWDLPEVVHPRQVSAKRGDVIAICRPINMHRYYDLFIKQIIDEVHKERNLEPVETYVV